MTNEKDIGEMFDKAQEVEKREIVNRLWSLAAFHGWELDIDLLDQALSRTEEE